VVLVLDRGHHLDRGVSSESVEPLLDPAADSSYCDRSGFASGCCCAAVGEEKGGGGVGHPAVLSVMVIWST
jgi:hypothetical protein